MISLLRWIQHYSRTSGSKTSERVSAYGSGKCKNSSDTAVNKITFGEECKKNGRMKEVTSSMTIAELVEKEMIYRETFSIAL